MERDPLPDTSGAPQRLRTIGVTPSERTFPRLELDAQALFVCRDVGLDDETVANLALQCRLKTM